MSQTQVDVNSCSHEERQEAGSVAAPPLLEYVLVTAARNEQAYIGKTIESVVAQTVLPRKYVIVSDGSTDQTDDIVKRYAAQYDFIELLRLENNGTRDFACQVYGQHAGVEQLRDIEYDLVGMLDADITVEPDYYERLLKKFQQNPRLGLAGGLLFDLDHGQWRRQKVNLSLNVSGPVQMFRRQCFEAIGGYIPLEKGGQDAVAEVMMRQHGWEVATFPDLKVLHYRPTGTEGKSLYRAKWACGCMEYLIGYHTLFMIVKCVSRVVEKPYLIGSLLRLCGYGWTWWRGEQRKVDEEFVAYLHQEQIRRIWSRSNHKGHKRKEDVDEG